MINLLFTLPARTPSRSGICSAGVFLMLFVTFTMLFFLAAMVPTYLLVRSLVLMNTYFVLLINGAISTTN